jgi:CRP-like cAMP-binding protein
MPDTTASDLRKALRGNFLFEALDEEELSALIDVIWPEAIPAGSVIVREGDDADALYLIVSGGVNVLKADGSFLSFLGAGGFFGEMALFSERARRSATCITTLDTTCAIIRKEDLHRFCDQHRGAGIKIYRSIIRVLSERLQATSADLAALMQAQIKSQASISSLVEKTRRKAQK